jgi:hypothetical protein
VSLKETELLAQLASKHDMVLVHRDDLEALRKKAEPDELEVFVNASSGEQRLINLVNEFGYKAVFGWISQLMGYRVPDSGGLQKVCRDVWKGLP